MRQTNSVTPIHQILQMDMSKQFPTEKLSLVLQAINRQQTAINNPAITLETLMSILKPITSSAEGYKCKIALYNMKLSVE